MKKVLCVLFMLATLAVSGEAAASRVAPSVSGTVTAVRPDGSQTLVTINGHTYTLASNQLQGRGGAIQQGQSVTLFLAADGKTVTTAQRTDQNASKP